MKDPAEIGARVLEVLDRGRKLQLERRRRHAMELADLVLRAARLDRAAGKPARGQAGRVARRLQLDGERISERHAREIIRNCGADSSTSGVSDVMRSAQGNRSTA